MESFIVVKINIRQEERREYVKSKAGTKEKRSPAF